MYNPFLFVSRNYYIGYIVFITSQFKLLPTFYNKSYLNFTKVGKTKINLLK